ncbi:MULTISPECIES: D-glycero-alpha-D-manno-heptose-1,7-bisphosphate 7-phosphatase [Ralstonia]|jgi:histidinol-phosphate phosphatase family protein|uniref:D,D-heptose 1,7-bisphosphate phosphatase n=1 Tax=Ralstonia mannitolilytica TaxID=105219 RepID=A0A0D5AUL7_9RALS|nr:MULTISPECIES: HAD family hydrolase [Ralstonia]AJW46762.1 HAD family hydrolase [Ralstonia mannitolilytica]ANA35109.1 HAD family hydrolase [Ralstonia mannitolilytica]MBU9577043.1 HAD family hydrolase [Ralstonia mannitolilytica]MBY4717050.1 HAD family hydrolase [Ralstonia mannitolilytica]PLT17797.1 HAD family hydrolase [Ralstonia mannitolilytica]
MAVMLAPARRTLPASGAAVFLDKDGTLLQDVPYNVDPARIALAPGAGDGLRMLARTGLPLIVVSNQPGVALGYFQIEALEAVAQRLAELFAQHGATLGGFYFCPHAPLPDGSAGCACRKPHDGLLRQAADSHGVTLEHSWMIGDILNDVEAGRRAGCRTILIANGNETHWLPGPMRVPDYIVGRFDEAAAIVIAQHARHAEAVA